MRTLIVTQLHDVLNAYVLTLNNFLKDQCEPTEPYSTTRLTYAILKSLKLLYVDPGSNGFKVHKYFIE